MSASLPASRPTAGVTDSDAIAEVVRGNREMFEVIVRRYNQRLYRVGMAYLRDHALAEDAMQNAYLKAFLHLDRFHGAATFATWLTRIMINECLMLLRRPARGREQLSEREPECESPAPGAAEQISLREMKHLLEQAIDHLPRNYRAVYILREVQQLSTAETAACLGLSSAAVKVTLHRARERLKSLLLETAAGAELFAYPATFCDPITARIMNAVLAVA
ncbi:MAG TPA: sigma-70 family RNA polymerase sigma factor [Opitutus sp.]|nr:sigma-70 family RNA polymerase sigma factor [Opitutus sp.]